MADILPFFGVLPKTEYASRVAALPYDVFDRREAAAQAGKDRLSFLNIDRPETQFDASWDLYAPEVYQMADAMLQKEIAEGIFQQDSERNYYIYELERHGRTQTGLVACASVDDYLDGVIKKHENTRPEKETDRVNHINATSAQTGPIFLTYRRCERISSVISRVKETKVPVFDFTSDDGVIHRGWRIDETSDIIEICMAFQEIDSIYIADGHHRAASAVRVAQMRREEHPDFEGDEEFNYFLCALFPEDELTILDYNRAIRDLNGLSEAEFLEKVQTVCEIKKLAGSSAVADLHPKKKGHISMYLSGKWYDLAVKDEFKSGDPVQGLDVSILQEQILDPVLGISDPSTDERILFVGGDRGLSELEHLVGNGYAAAFAMFPTTVEELIAVADAGALMPPKSTWFEPKLRSGLFLHLFER